MWSPTTGADLNTPCPTKIQLSGALRGSIPVVLRGAFQGPRGGPKCCLLDSISRKQVLESEASTDIPETCKPSPTSMFF